MVVECFSLQKVAWFKGKLLIPANMVGVTDIQIQTWEMLNMCSISLTWVWTSLNNRAKVRLNAIRGTPGDVDIFAIVK